MHAQKCAVRGCPHWRVEEDNDTFYKFPDNNKLREKWRLACGMSNAPRGSIICGVHFTKDLFKPNTRPGSTRKLRADAIPNQLLVSTEQWDNIPADPAVANSSLQELDAVEGDPCRLCNTAKRGIHNLFDCSPDNGEMSYSAQIQEMFQIEIPDNQEWSRRSCLQCVRFLDEMKKFKNRIQETQSILEAIRNKEVVDLADSLPIAFVYVGGDPVVEAQMEQLAENYIDGSSNREATDTTLDCQDSNDDLPINFMCVDGDRGVETHNQMEQLVENYIDGSSNREATDTTLDCEDPNDDLPIAFMCVDGDRVVEGQMENLAENCIDGSSNLEATDTTLDCEDANEDPSDGNASVCDPESEITQQTKPSNPRRHKLEIVMRKMGLIKCHLCLKTEEKLADLRKHYRVKHRDSARILCCGQSFLTHNSNRAFDHIETHLNPDAFKCRECGKACINSKALKVHMVARHVPKSIEENFKCPQCDKAFQTNCVWKRHISQVHGKAVWHACHICDLVFPNQSDLEEHNTDSHRGAKPIAPSKSKHPEGGVLEKCNICNDWFSNLFTHNRHHHPMNVQKVYHSVPGWNKALCDQCGKYYAVGFGLQTHQSKCGRLSEGRKREPVICDICGRVCASKQYLKVHMYSHNDARGQFDCPHCDVKTSTKGHKWRHIFYKHPEEYEKGKCEAGSDGDEDDDEDGLGDDGETGQAEELGVEGVAQPQEVAKNDLGPYFPIQSVADVRVVDDLMDRDAEFRRLVTKELQTAKETNSISNLFQDEALSPFTMYDRFKDTRDTVNSSSLLRELKAILGADAFAHYHKNAKARFCRKVRYAKLRADLANPII